jgi:predicted ATPase
LGARIDALPQAQRSALEAASVIGTTFTEALLRALCGVDIDSADFSGLRDAGIIIERDEPGSVPGDWRFRHQLFVDAAYGRLLADRRQALHSSLAQLLDVAEPRADVAEIARHHLAAGDRWRALPLLEQAAREAAAVGARAEAESFARTAAEIRGTFAAPLS